MPECNLEKIIKISLPLWSVYAAGIAAALFLPLISEFFFYGLQLSMLFYGMGVILWLAGGLTGLFSLLKGGWITVCTVVLQIVILFVKLSAFKAYHIREAVAIGVTLIPVWLYWKRLFTMNKAAVIAVHLLCFGIILLIGFWISDRIFPLEESL